MGPHDDDLLLLPDDCPSTSESTPLPSLPIRYQYPTPVFPPSTITYVPIQAWDPSSVQTTNPLPFLTTSNSTKTLNRLPIRSTGPPSTNIDLNIFNNVAPLGPLRTRFGTFKPTPSSSTSPDSESSPGCILTPDTSSRLSFFEDPPCLSPAPLTSETVPLSTSTSQISQDKLFNDLLKMPLFPDPLIGSAAINCDPGMLNKDLMAQLGLIPDPVHRQLLEQMRRNESETSCSRMLCNQAADADSAWDFPPKLYPIKRYTEAVEREECNQPLSIKRGLNAEDVPRLRPKFPRTTSEMEMFERHRRSACSSEESDSVMANWDNSAVEREVEAMHLVGQMANRLGLADPQAQVAVLNIPRIPPEEFVRGMFPEPDCKLKKAMKGEVWNGRKKKSARGRGATEKKNQKKRETLEYCERVKIEYKLLEHLEERAKEVAYKEPFNGDREFLKDVVDCVRDLIFEVVNKKDADDPNKKKRTPRTTYAQRTDLNGFSPKEYDLRRNTPHFYGEC